MSLRKFEIQEMIAKGGMAEVFLAKTVGLEGFAKQVCVKKILPHLTEDQNFVTMFIDEAKLAATLNYANIVQVHDLCVSANHEYFIVMEYVHGKDLSDVIRAAQLQGKELPPDIAVYIARETCKGLYYAHTKTDAEGAPLNIIHRDVSPQNVLISYMGEVKITDFGIAKASSSMNKTAVGILKGKYGYMSPEQARGERIDPRSDLFNLGILLYEMLVGERCFAGASDYSTLNLMREAKVTPPTKINKEVPKELEAIVMRALARKPGDRFQDALELEGALATWAKAAGQLAGEAELARMMKSLFKDEKKDNKDTQTGVIQLSSVVGPPPKDEPKKKEPVKTREAKQKSGPEKSARAESSSAQVDASSRSGSQSESEPGRKAIERAKARKSTRMPSTPEVARPSSEAKADKPKEPPAKRAEVKEAKPASAKKLARIEKKKPEPEDQADKGGKDDKKRQKEEAKANRRPVGRRDLKPNLTELQKMKRPGGRRNYLVALMLIVLGGAAGAAGGFYQSRTSVQQSIFRTMERTEAEVSKDDAVNIVVNSLPKGAAVWLDGAKLADTTPLVVTRPRDAEEHSIKIAVKGLDAYETKFSYAKGPVTIVEHELDGAKAELALYSKPSGLKARVDSKEVGATPLSIDVSPGEHVVEIGGGDRELIKKTIVAEPGKKVTVNPNVPSAGRLSTLDIQSQPSLSIVIDGISSGASNGAPIPLDPGVKHKVSLVDLNGTTQHEFTVELAEGEKRQMFLDLRDAS